MQILKPICNNFCFKPESEQYSMIQDHKVLVGDETTAKITDNEPQLNLDTLEYEGSYQYVIKTLTDILQTIAADPEIPDYFAQIELKDSEIAHSFRQIIESLKQLHLKSKESRVMRHGIGKGWIFLQDFFRTKDINRLDSKGKTVWFLEIQTKLACSLQFLHSFKEYEDITNSPKEKYPQVWSRIRSEPVRDIVRLKKDSKGMKKMLHMAASAILNEESHSFKITKLLAFGCSFPKYMVMTDSAKLRSLIYYRNPTIQLAQKFWNLPENGAIREFNKLNFESIKTNKKIYLPPDGVFNNKTDIFTENPKHITVRILYSKKLKIYSERESVACCVRGPQQVKQIDTVLLHMHGGGFIALSSRSMQCYTRKWANELDVPIFSIDYRKPPHHPFPQAPYDCLLVYQFLLNHVHQFMNVRPTNIYLAGDSAGGNLCFALTGLILKHKLPIPKGLYCAYPATDLRMLFTQSKLNAITDVLLWPSTLLLCLREYLKGENQKATDPLASPVLLDEQWVNGSAGDKRFPVNWPRTRLTVGNKDPLFDDTLNVMERMVKSKIDCDCVVYQELSHGYLNTEMVIKEAEKTVKDSIEHLKDLLGVSLSKTENK